MAERTVIPLGVSTLAPDNYNPSSLEGFYLHLVAKSKSRQTELFKFAIARLAKEFPAADPRVVLLEWLAERIYDYEQWRTSFKSPEQREYHRKFGTIEGLQKAWEETLHTRTGVSSAPSEATEERGDGGGVPITDNEVQQALNELWSSS